jgi:TolB-like protein
MDLFARIFDWLREQEAGFSAMAAIAVLAGILFTGVRLLLGRRTQPVPEPISSKTAEEEDPLLALPTGPVVAVLPFENLSRDPDQEYFSDGLTDDIITALSRFKDLFVIARNSTFRYKGQPVDVRQLNKELGARYVLEGSVQRAGDALRVTAQLLDAKDGTHLWAETYDRELSAASVFAVQDEIAEQVVGTIAGGAGVIHRERLAEIRGKPPDHLAAYECVLQVVAFARDKLVPTEHAKVRGDLERAVELDPGYAEAWAYLSQIYLLEHALDFNPLPNPLGRASDAARRAIDLDSTSQSAHWALAMVHFYRSELDAFRAEAERAIALNPNRTALLAHLGQALFQAGDERGISFVRKAMKLDPYHPTWFHLPISAHHFLRGEYEEALAAVRRIDIPGNYVTQIFLAAIQAQLGRESEARSAIQELLRLRPGYTIERHAKQQREMNVPERRIQRWATALRKAGLPE